jgi:hypothetical protein
MSCQPGILRLSLDIQILIMSELDSLTTLLSFLIAIPPLTMPFAHAFTTILRAILTQSLQDVELEQHLLAVIAARSVIPKDPTQLRSFLDDYFGKNADCHPLPPCVPHDRTSLEYMVNVLEAVEFFHLYAEDVWRSALRALDDDLFDEWQRDEYDEPPTYTPASDEPMQSPTALRMRRALLRIQLHTELFHQTGGDSNDWETRGPEIKIFWGQYGLAEMRECKCIYEAISVSVEHELRYKKLGPPRDEDPLQLRGLPQLQRCLRPPDHFPTKFGLSYVRRFLRTSCFSDVDPRDDMWHNHQVVPTIFQWDDGPHGGLGQVRRKFAYIYEEMRDADSRLCDRIVESFACDPLQNPMLC